MTYFTSLKTINKSVVGLMVAALFAAAFIATGPSAKAADTSVGGSASLTGSLTFVGNTPLSFSKTLTGADQTANSNFIVEVLDTTANPAGWEISATMDNFVLGTNNSKTLAPVSILSGVAQTVNGLGSAANEVDLSGGVQLGSGPQNTKAIFWTQNTNEVQHTGITFNAQLAIPANTVQGNYTSTINLTLAPHVS